LRSAFATDIADAPAAAMTNATVLTGSSAGMATRVITRTASAAPTITINIMMRKGYRGFLKNEIINIVKVLIFIGISGANPIKNFECNCKENRIANSGISYAAKYQTEIIRSRLLSK
jgi:hypothetical protein